MKWMKRVVLGVALSAAIPAFCAEAPVETPRDYAFGMALETSPSAPWFRIDLPSQVYQQSAWPDMRDVRVFNQQGETVPFSVVVQKTAAAAPETIPLRVFPLTAAPFGVNTDSRRASESMVLRSSGGLEVHLQSEAARNAGQSYLLALPDESKVSRYISQLQLDWKTPAGNWQGKVSLYTSHDLDDWRLQDESVTLMDLTSGTDRLKMNRLSLSTRLSSDGTRYLLLVFADQTPPLTLTGASALPRSRDQENDQIVLKSAENRVSENEAIYQWAQPQPLTSIAFELENGSVLPVELAWRGAVNEPWQPLTKQVLYSLDNRNSEPFPMQERVVQAIRLTTVNAHLPETLPEISGRRDQLTIVFNAQGNAPYMLAWGNGAAEPASIAMNMLIPEALEKAWPLDAIPRAQALEPVTLGGEERLTATSEAERASQWQTMLVWGALIFGVVLLLVMAWRIWREVKNKPE
ncbi:putative transmembrane protein [Trabulsiella guamensis ATCC 49490]|uniref:Putative transmembrane protein n=1 Tax=Trabulsiella guamensis ATCC 49490 TaxID=1005994 RepID=A0A085AE98_9ENTR|nr:DUF3999 domain-containing protein [Trabulsiella guamensis]KFC08543.1 putative transmembrane protein [Trabulsiella guamensis ATCC 49490]